MLAPRDRRQAGRFDAPGFSLIEMVVVLALVSLLAGLAAPSVAKKAVREKEYALRAELRQVRTALDRFHADWREAGGADAVGGGFSQAASENGYPVSLDVLVEGVDLGTVSGRRVRYLRRVPLNPLVAPDAASHWTLLPYGEGGDVWDIRSAHAGEALDGSRYEEW